MTAAVLEAALKLYSVDSNGQGGSKAYKVGLEALEKALAELQPQQIEIANILGAWKSDKKIEMKTGGTWRRYLWYLVKQLGGTEEQLTVKKVREDDKRQAEAKIKQYENALCHPVPGNSASAPSCKKQKVIELSASACADQSGGPSESQVPAVTSFLGNSTSVPSCVKRKISEFSDSAGNSLSAPSCKKRTISDFFANTEQSKGGSDQNVSSNEEPPHLGCAEDYQTLGLEAHAGEKQIRQAFLQQAKQHHPDKGGSAAAFRKVLQAYEALINKLQQPHSAVPEESEDPTKLAKAVYARMLQLPRHEWKGHLDATCTQVLEALSSELQAILEQKPDGDASSSATSDIGIGCKQGRWWVQISWRSLKVRANGIESMERALSLQAELLKTKQATMQRFRGEKEKLAALGLTSMPSNRELDSIPVITDVEMWTLLRQEPFIVLQFTSDLTEKPRTETPWVPCLELALELRAQCRMVQAKRGNMAKCKQDMMRRAKDARLKHMEDLKSAATLIAQMASSRTRLEAAAGPAALQEKSAEETEAMRQRMLEQLEAKDQELLAKDEQLQEAKDQQLLAKEQLLQAKNETIQAKTEQLQAVSALSQVSGSQRQNILFRTSASTISKPTWMNPAARSLSPDDKFDKAAELSRKTRMSPNPLMTGSYGLK